VLAALMILGVTYLIIVNFTTLIGGSRTTATWLMITVPVVFAIGLVLNAVTRSRAHEWRPGEDVEPTASSNAPAI
jgi:hypothetical protein